MGTMLSRTRGLCREAVPGEREGVSVTGRWTGSTLLLEALGLSPTTSGEPRRLGALLQGEAASRRCHPVLVCLSTPEPCLSCSGKGAFEGEGSASNVAALVGR